MLPSWLTCVVLSGYSLVRCILVQISTTPWSWVMLVRYCHSVEVPIQYVLMRFIVMLMI
jgi:hypothetical protein